MANYAKAEGLLFRSRVLINRMLVHKEKENQLQVRPIIEDLRLNYKYLPATRGQTAQKNVRTVEVDPLAYSTSERSE